MYFKTSLGLFSYILLHCIVFYDVNIIILPFNIIGYNSRIYKGGFHEDVTCQHPLFVNNLNNHHYFTNYSTNNRSVFTKVPPNSITNCLINNYIKDGDLPNSEIAPLSNV